MAFKCSPIIRELGWTYLLPQWSERMRAPMEAVYGKEGFPKLWAEFNRGFREIKTELGGKFCDLDRIRCPTLVIHGNKDAMVDPGVQFNRQFLGPGHF